VVQRAQFRAFMPIAAYRDARDEVVRAGVTAAGVGSNKPPDQVFLPAVKCTDEVVRITSSSTPIGCAKRAERISMVTRPRPTSPSTIAAAGGLAAASGSSVGTGESDTARLSVRRWRGPNAASGWAVSGHAAAIPGHLTPLGHPHAPIALSDGISAHQ